MDISNSRSAKDPNGECCQKNFLNGVPVIIILASGVKRKMTTQLALLKKF